MVRAVRPDTLGLGGYAAAGLRRTRAHGSPNRQRAGRAPWIVAKTARSWIRMDLRSRSSCSTRKNISRTLCTSQSERSMSARENILRRIREANGREAGETAGRRIAIRKKLDDRSRGPLPTMAWEPVPHFKERCIAMMSTVSEVESLDGVPHALASYLKANQLPATGVCWAEFAALNWAGSGLTIEARPSHAEDKLGITGVFCALAENGTLMLLSGETTPATTSLLPETHVAVVPFSRIVR